MARKDRGSRKNGSCKMPCASTVGLINLKVTNPAAAARNRAMLNQVDVRMNLFMRLCSFSVKVMLLESGLVVTDLLRDALLARFLL